MGFEPTEACTSHAFEACSFGRSDTLPRRILPNDHPCPPPGAFPGAVLAVGPGDVHNSPVITRCSIRRLSLLAAVAAAVVVTGGCAPVQEDAPTSGGATCEPGSLPTLTAGTLTIGTDEPVYPPWYVDNDPANGQGFESAVAYAIADQLGYGAESVTWVRVPFNAAIAPGPKTYDLNLTEFSITDERRQAVDFSAPYYDVAQTVVALDGSPVAAATTIAELQSARLGAQIGTTSYTAAADQIAPTTEVAVFNTNDDALVALSNGQIDAVVVDLPTAFYVTSAQLEGASIVGQLPAGSGEAEQFGAVLDLGSPLTPCVSTAVEGLRSNGTLDALEEEWLASEGDAPLLR